MSVSTRAATRPRPAPQDGTQAFAGFDWLLAAGVAFSWGSSFLFIDIGVDSFDPGLVAFLRILFGALALGLFADAHRSVPRSELPLIALLGVLWMAFPFMFFSVAQQWIDSSLAGMINAAAPLFTAVVAAIAVRHVPGRVQIVGLIVGFAGVVAISLPSIGDEDSSLLGIGLVLLATLFYGCAFNLAAPLQRRNGALPVIWRAQLVALCLLAPVAAASVPGSSFAWSSLGAVIALGSLGTALGFVCFTTLAGRVGSTRASVTIYLLPAVAIALGAMVRDEPIHAAALLGTALVLAGAYLTSRREAAGPGGGVHPRRRVPRARRTRGLS